jgi:3-isopropylmalate/(R)-2-methylmalate dehydratase small subunit
MEPQNQHRFLNGLDDIGITLSHADQIASFETTRPSWLSK